MADEPTDAKDAGTPAAATDGASELRSVHTTTLPELLNQISSSVLVSTYQAGKLIAVRPEGPRANTHFRNFNQPMGLAWDGGRLAIGTLTQVWEYQNQPDVARRLPAAEITADGCLVPRRAHVTGNIGVHELAYAGGELWVVNTRFSCLCTLAADASFVPRWRPPFITGLSH